MIRMNSVNFMFRCVTALVLAVLVPGVAFADPYSDALHVEMRYSINNVPGTVRIRPGAEGQYVTAGSALLVETTSAVDALRLRANESIRVCVRRRVPRPSNDVDRTSANQDVWEDLIGSQWVQSDPAHPLPSCPDRGRAATPTQRGNRATQAPPSDADVQAARTDTYLTLPTTGAHQVDVAGTFVFGSSVVVDVWAPTTRGTNREACALSPPIAGLRSHSAGSDGEWVLLSSTAHIWDWNEYLLWEKGEGDYRRITELDSEVAVDSRSRLVIGRIDEGETSHRRGVVWGSVDYEKVFRTVCVTLRRADGQGPTTTLSPTGIVGEATDRGYSLASLPVGTEGILNWGIKSESTESPCLTFRDFRLVRRPTGVYVTFPIVTEVIAAISNLDATNVNASSTAAVSWSCDVRPDLTCRAGAIFPLVLSYNTRSVTLSNYAALFVGPQITLFDTTPHVGVAMGARFGNALLLGANYDIASDAWQMMVGGDVKGLGDLIARFTR